MRNLLKKYYKMNDEQKNKLEDLLILHNIEIMIDKHKDLDIVILDEEIIFDIVKNIYESTNLRIDLITNRIFDILEGSDITTDDVFSLNTDELIELISDNEEYTEKEDYEIISKFVYGGFECSFVRDGKNYILVFERDNNSHVEIFKSLEQLLGYVIKNILLSEGENIIV